MYVILGGLGVQGRAILKYLMNETNEDIIIVDLERELPQDIKNEYHDFERLTYWANYSWWPSSCWANAIPETDNVVVISCLPTEKNLEATKTCVAYKFNMIDLGGVTSVVKEQFEEDYNSKIHQITIVPDCGLAPGIVSSLASFYEKANWKSVEIFCGGIPKFPKPPFSYSKMFYPGGVVKEFSGVAQEILNGKVINVPTRSGRELLSVPGFGVLEAIVTSGGVSITPNHLKLDRFSYKTLRYPGHLDYLEKYILSQSNPTVVLDKILEEVDADNPDVIILCVRLRDVNGPVFREFFWEYDDATGLSAMSQATGYTVAAVATMIHDGLIRYGVVGMHEIDAQEIITRAQQMPKQYSEDPPNF